MKVFYIYNYVSIISIHDSVPPIPQCHPLPVPPDFMSSLNFIVFDSVLAPASAGHTDSESIHRNMGNLLAVMSLSDSGSLLQSQKPSTVLSIALPPWVVL